MADSENLRQAVLRYAQRNKHKKVGRGECWDLAHLALTEGAKAKSAADYGSVTRTSDDRWGESIDVASAQPGDIVQFKDHKATLTTLTTTKLRLPDGRTLTYRDSHERTLSRGHHTAIVLSSLKDGKMTVLEQHVRRGSSNVDETVDEGLIYLEDSSAPPRTRTDRIHITPHWVHERRSSLDDQKQKQLLDSTFRPLMGQLLEAEIETTESITVSGTVRAYRPQPQ